MNLILESCHFLHRLALEILKHLDLSVKCLDYLCVSTQFLALSLKLLLASVEIILHLLRLFLMSHDQLFVHLNKIELALLQLFVGLLH